MKTKLVSAALALLALSVFNSQLSTVHAQGTAFTYQGRLNAASGPANGSYDLIFTLFDSDIAGVAGGGPVTNSATVVSNGLFTTTIDFGPGVFTGGSNWLELAVQTNGGSNFTTLAPRQQLTPVPYAIYSGIAAHADTATLADQASSVLGGVISVPQLNTLAAPGAGQVLGYNGTQLVWQDPVIGGASGGWSLTGNLGTSPGINFLGTLDNQPLLIEVGGVRALRLEPDLTGAGAPNVIGGSPENYVASGVVGATIGGGGAVSYLGNTYTNSVTASFAAIGGGVKNTAGGQEAFVGGGFQNTASGYISTIPGGAYNVANGNEAFVGGGADNTATTYAFVGGGFLNNASAVGAVIVGGGFDGSLQPGNSAAGQASFIGGGLGNSITANGYAAGVSGGYQNSASGSYAFIGGGVGNTASGNDQVADGTYPLYFYFWGSATVSGGNGNTASATCATVPGGYNNTAAGDFSFAGGYHASALHNGSFVWADDSSSATFADTSFNQFDIRAAGGLRLTSVWGIGLEANDDPIITRGWDPFASTAGNKAGHGRWGLFMEPTALVNGIAGPDVGYRQYEVSGYNTDGTRHAYLTVGNNGVTSVHVLAITGGSDLAEPFKMGGTEIPKGSVVVIDKAHPGELKLSSGAYDKTVAGIVSGANGINPGIALHQEGALEGGQNVALTGRVYVRADAANGAIEPGDLLTTSDVPGHAMKVTDYTRAQGAIIGKAMTALTEGKGMVLVLVSLQ
jgi:hypothetical protein